MDDFHLGLEQELPRLRRYAYGLARNKALADDLVQDTYSRAIDKAHLWQPGTNLRGWLFTIMHNQNANAIRRSVRDQANAKLYPLITPSRSSRSQNTIVGNIVANKAALGRRQRGPYRRRAPPRPDR